jgi:endoglucanase
MRTYRLAERARPAWSSVAIALALCLALLLVGAQPLLNQPRPPAIPAPTPLAPPCSIDPAGFPAPRMPNGAPLSYWHTCGTAIVDRNGKAVQIAGVSWSGMELPGGAPGGLDRRSYREILLQLKGLGYNVVRIPFSSQSLQPNSYPTGINAKLNPDLVGLNSLEVLDRIVAECQKLGLKVILDHHRIDPYSVPDLWYNGSYSTADWLGDWIRLADRYRGNDAVVAFDLQNEPYHATWGTNDPATDWRLAAQEAGDAILRENPDVLIFVEGIGQYAKQPYYWYGGELQGVRTMPIALDLPGRLVYSPHEYGPSVYPEAWFSASDFPSNLPAIWQQHWGFIQNAGLAPVVVGETGAPETGYDVGGTWQRVFLSFLSWRHVGFIVWAANPEASDTGSVFLRDWRTINQPREALYAPYLAGVSHSS